LHALTNAKLHYKQQDGQSYANQLSAMITKLKGQNRGQAVHHREPDSVYLARPRDV
jgi:phage-related protein